MMGMFISINENGGLSTSSGVFDCIVESTREKFTEEQRNCKKAIYETLDEEEQSFIALNYIDDDCFNLFHVNLSY